jgi:putative ABC transport system substrate-binding protein
MRRLGVLMGKPESDEDGHSWTKALLKGLQQLGWTEGRNVRIDIRWGANSADRVRTYSAELVSLKPDVILVNNPLALMGVQQTSRDIPIVFAAISNPVGLGIVESLARPGGNVTGFTLFEGSMVGKLLEALREIAPGVARVALVFNPDNPAGADHLHLLETIAPRFGVKPVAAPVHNATEIEHAIEAFAREPNGGLVLPPDFTTGSHRDLIIALAARHSIPAVSSNRAFVIRGGLMSYGPDLIDQYFRAASYVDRILKGANPAELPVQQPTKFQFVINLKSAKALGLEVPPMLLGRADEVIE